MGLRDLVIETYGTDEGLVWNGKTGLATINGVSFGSSASNAYINSSGKMIIDTAVFAKAMGLNEISSNALLDLSRSYNLAKTDSQRADIIELDKLVRNITAKNKIISDYSPISGRIQNVEKVLYTEYPTAFSVSYADALWARYMTSEIYGSGYSNDDRADAFRHAYWNALSTIHIGSDLTRIFTNAHEYGFGDNLLGEAKYSQTVMDLNNNAVGRYVGEYYPSSRFVEVLSGLSLEDRLVIIRNGELVPANQGYYWSAP